MSKEDSYSLKSSTEIKSNYFYNERTITIYGAIERKKNLILQEILFFFVDRIQSLGFFFQTTPLYNNFGIGMGNNLKIIFTLYFKSCYLNHELQWLSICIHIDLSIYV